MLSSDSRPILSSVSRISSKLNMKSIVLISLLGLSLEMTQAFDIEQNPCNELHCSAGRECIFDTVQNKARCECIKDCGHPANTDPRRMVCTNHNETFKSDCELHQLRCFCEDGVTSRCSNPDKYLHAHIDYFGECKSMPECKPEELLDFPRRMREWLFNVMEQLAERAELSEYYVQLQKEAKFDMSKRWTNAAIWKWCDLDGEPKDNVVSRHELFLVTAPLKTLEHCLSDFLDSCDADNDHGISFEEWAKCLHLEESDLEAKCEQL